MSRYKIGAPGDGEYQFCSSGKVLRNKLGLTNPARIALVESTLLAVAQARSLGHIETNTVFSVALVQGLHRSWLGSLYHFAGEIRNVNMSKGAVVFAPVAYLETTLNELDQVFSAETPCQNMSKDRLIHALARVHAELILAHPFREGNGRLARWVADLMSLQAGFPALDWEFDVQSDERRGEYFSALRDGFAMNFRPLEDLVSLAIERAVRLMEGPSA